MRAVEGVGTGAAAARSQAAAESSGRGLVGGMGRAALVALTALGGCLLLIVVGAAMSMCWAVHPLLTVAAAALVVWLVSRVAALVLRTGSRPD